ncbi:MAG TPA: GAF domain-containing protein [Anaerolineae bacterium]|nr:GAF domain-containing protein [Anaerolineae bacterium]
MTDHDKWRQMLDLGRQLASRPTLSARRELILSGAERLLEGSALLWLSPSGQQPPSETEEASSGAQPATEAMLQALHTRLTAVVDSAGEHTVPTLAVPLLAGDDVLGVLQVQRPGAGPFSERETQLLEGWGTLASIIVHSAQQLEAGSWQCEQLQLVREVSVQVASILDLDTLLDEIVHLLYQRLGYPFVHLFTVDPVSRRIRYRAGVGLRSQAAQQHGLSYDLDDGEGVIPWVARHGETVLANDVAEEPRYRPSPLPPANTRSELAVPLIFGNQVLGVLDVQSDRLDAFSENDRFVIEALAASIAVAIRNADLYRSEQWRRRVGDSMQRVAGLLAEDVSIDQVLEAVLIELERNLPCDAAAIWLLHDGELCLSAARGFPEGLCIADVSSEAHPWLSAALQGDRPSVRDPGSPPEPLGAMMGFASDYSAIAAPLHSSDGQLGLLTMVHREPGRYGPESRMMTATFASYAAVAIENARLYQAAQEQAYVSTVLLQVAEATQSQTTLDEVLETIVRLTPMLTGVERCALLLWDEADEKFLPATSYGLSPEQQADFGNRIVGLRCAVAFEMLETTRAPIFVPGVADELGLPAGDEFGCGFLSPWLVPLTAHGAVLGALLVDYQGDDADGASRGELGDSILAILRGIAYQAAAAVSNTQLLQERQEEAYVSVALLQVAQVVVSLDVLDDILEAIVHITSMLAGVKWCVIFNWDAEQKVFQPAQAYGLPDDGQKLTSSHLPLPLRRYSPEEFPLLAMVRESDSLVSYPPEASDVATTLIPADFAADFHLLQGEEAPSLIAVPLSVMGDVLGVMLVEESQDSHGAHRLRDRRLELITGIARQAALAVQNDRLLQERAGLERLERELQLAHELQQTFLPERSPQLPGWDLAFAWQAAREVGGDFYDFLDLEDGRLGLAIADVADKGMPAALFMILTRTLLRAAALQDMSPASTLSRVNGLLLPDAHQESMFVTAAYAVLELESGRLVYASAGHNPALLLPLAGKPEWLRCKGAVLGVMESIDLQERSFVMEPGDHLVFYTDGVTEAFSPQGDIYGEERLLAAAQAVAQADAGSSAQAMVEAILASVREFVGEGPVSDDLTLLVLHRSMP